MGTHDAIWLALLNSARWERYYRILTDRFMWWETVIRSVLLASAMGSISSFISDMPAAVGVVFGVFVAAAVIVDFVVRPGQTAATLALIRDECGRMRLTLDDLLRRYPGMADVDANWMLKTLNSHLEDVTAKDPTTCRDKLNEKTTRDTFSEMEHLYAS